jgi:hypothetical protein
MRIRCRFIKHMLWALVWLVCLICCIEVGFRVRAVVMDQRLAEMGELPVVASYCTHHVLEPLSEVRLNNPDEEGTVSARLNSLGLRGPEPATVKTDDLLRIVCLGDEMTFGPGLSDVQLFTAKLKKLFEPYVSRKLEVINAGVPEYCPLLSLLQYRHQLRALDPDVIVLTFEMGDVADDYRVRAFTSLDANGIPLACRNPRLGKTSDLERLENHFITLKWMKSWLTENEAGSSYDSLEQIDHAIGRFAWIRDNPDDWAAYVQNALKPIGQLAEMAREQDALVVLAVVPAPWQVSAEATGDPAARKRFGIAPSVVYDNRKPFDLLAAAAADAGVEYFDVSQIFSHQAGNPEELYLHTQPWLSARGHEAYANLLAQFLFPRLQSRFHRPPSQIVQEPAASPDQMLR